MRPDRRTPTVRSIGRLSLLVVALSVSAGGTPVAGQAKQYPIFAAEHFITAMKTAGQAFAAVEASVGRSELEDAKAYLAISRDRLATTITFWRDRKKDDAIKMLRDTVAKLDEVDALLSAEKVDPAAVGARVRQAGTSCEACHAVYREQDPVTKAYRLKSGLD